MKKNNLLNDFRYAEAYVVARKRKGFGPKKIKFELLSKGIDESDINKVLNEEGGWKKAAKKVFDKKSIKLKAIKGIPILNEVFKFSLVGFKNCIILFFFYRHFFIIGIH